MSSNQPSLEPIVIRVLRVTSSGTTPPPNGPELTWIVLASTFETQPIVSPSAWSRSTVMVSDGSAGHSVKMTTARSTTLPTAAIRESSRLLPGATCLLVEKPLDRVEHRVLVLAGLGGGGRAGGRRGPDVLPHAVVLLPALEGVVQVDDLPLRVAVLQEPRHLPRQGLGEAAHVVAVLAAEVEGDQHRLHRHGVDRGPLPLVDVDRDLGARVELGDALVGDGDQLEPVLLGHVLLEELHRIAPPADHRVDATRLELAERLA